MGDGKRPTLWLLTLLKFGTQRLGGCASIDPFLLTPLLRTGILQSQKIITLRQSEYLPGDGRSPKAPGYLAAGEGPYNEASWAQSGGAPE